MFLESEITASRRWVRWGFAVGMAVFLAGMTMGCGRDEVAVYQVPKEDPASRPAAGADPHTHMAADPHQGMTMPARLKWDAPEGWEAQPAGGMRLANYLVPGGNQTGQVSVVVLPQVVGRDFEVLNIFRERLQVPPLEPGEVTELEQRIPVGSESGRLYDMLGAAAEDGGEQNRLLVAVFEDGQASYYFNFFGPSSLIEAEKPQFVALLKSVEKDDESIAAATTTGPAAGSPPVATAAASASGRPQWEVPDGWLETPPTQMLLARFEAGGDAGNAEITVSMFPGDVGGTVANVNRWRGQIGLAPWDESEVKQALTTLEVEGGYAAVVEMLNEQSGKRLIGVIWPRGTHTWFYKMMGDDAVVGEEKAAFIRFVQSVRHTNA
jgi:hypothetical protein